MELSRRHTSRCKATAGFSGIIGASPSTYYNPSVASAVELARRQQYQLRYNSYAELARVELPTVAHRV